MDVDFANMVAEILSAYGYKEAQLAKVLGVSQPTVHRLKTGEIKDPGFGLGRRIVELHSLRPAIPKQPPDTAGSGADVARASNGD